jgi:hypothetical protein
MRYRALAVNLEKDGHPVQFFSNSLFEANSWSQKVADAERCTVFVFEIKEERISEFVPAIQIMDPVRRYVPKPL